MAVCHHSVVQFVNAFAAGFLEEKWQQRMDSTNERGPEKGQGKAHRRDEMFAVRFADRRRVVREFALE